MSFFHPETDGVEGSLTEFLPGRKVGGGVEDAHGAPQCGGTDLRSVRYLGLTPGFHLDAKLLAIKENNQWPKKAKQFD